MPVDNNTKGHVRVAFRAIAALVVMPALCGLVACSRKEQPKTPAKPPTQVSPVAVPVTNAAPLTVSQHVEAVAVRTGKVEEVRMGPTPGHYMPPKPDVSTPERKHALRANQREFARNAIAKALAQNGQERTAIEISLIRQESNIRQSDPTVTSAYQAWSQARSAYESVCATAIVGHADLTHQAVELRARVDKDMAAGAAADTNAMDQALQRLDDVNRSLGNLERKAIYDQPIAAVTQAHAAVTAADEAYRKALRANDTYRSEMEKRVGLLSERTNLLTRQGELSSEN